MSSSQKIKLATVWLDGCSGCHMSFLDIDERLLELGDKVDLVYSPLVDFKEYPEQVDVVLVEGSVSTTDDLKKIRMIRQRTKTLIALGDCAVTGNIPAMRNGFDLQRVCNRAYVENVQMKGGMPTEGVPELLEPVRPVHQVVDVDLFIPGCPPEADAIWAILTAHLEGREVEATTHTRFGR